MKTLFDPVYESQDDRIYDDVCRQIMWQTDIQSQEIMVEVRDSVVILSGRVETCLERMEAEKAARAVYGVSSAINQIQVEAKCARSDPEIAYDVIAGLQFVSFVLEQVPKVTVCDGIVTLEGKVRWTFQRESAERAAEGVVGVREVRNYIDVVPLGSVTPCRQLARRQTAAGSSLMTCGPRPEDDGVRSLYFVPSSIGRA